MRIIIKHQWDGFDYDWLLIPTVLIAARKPILYREYGFGIGIGLLFLKYKLQFFILINKKPQNES